MLCEQKFSQIYGREPEALSFCPYRICPIGAHSDHNLGKITGFAIDKGIHIAYAPKQNGVIEMVSLQFLRGPSGTSTQSPDRSRTTGPTTFAEPPSPCAGNTGLRSDYAES